MARRQKPKPKTPEQIQAEKLIKRAQDFEAVGLQPEAAALESHAFVEVQRADQKHEQRVNRIDVFDALRAGMAPGAFDAVRRFERDMLIRFGQHDYGRTPDRVDCEQAAFGRTDLMIAAGERVDRVLAFLSERDGWLLSELIIPNPARPTWREAVGYITGESHSHAQGAAVRAACVNLRDAYDRAPRKAA